MELFKANHWFTDLLLNIIRTPKLEEYLKLIEFT